MSPESAGSICRRHRKRSSRFASRSCRRRRRSCSGPRRRSRAAFPGKPALIFIDPWYGKWLEVGGSGLEWNEHPLAYGLRLSTPKILPRGVPLRIEKKKENNTPPPASGKGEFDFPPPPKPKIKPLLEVEEFARMSAQAESDSTISARDRRIFSRQLHSRAEHGASDRQGRLVLPGGFLQAARLEGRGRTRRRTRPF